MSFAVIQAPSNASQTTVDLVVVGSGFASTFFVHRFLQRCERNARIVVLERGQRREHQWHLQNSAQLAAASRMSFVNATPAKPWVFRLTFGGGSNCWWGCTPRLLPEDFLLQSTHGMASDWPLTYEEVEPYYSEAEELMAIAGPADSPFARSRPYPQPAHRLSDPDRALKKAFPDQFFAQPCARPTRAVETGRPACCANGVCDLCPINSKFTILNGMSEVFSDPRVRIETEAEVVAVETRAGRAAGVHYRRGGRDVRLGANLVAVGANAIFNPSLLQKSGLSHPLLGAGLMEQVSRTVEIDLAGLDNFQGGTSLTGHGYMLYGGSRRRDRAGALIETWNVPSLRNERGRWRQRLVMKVIFEDVPREENRVVVEPGTSRPVTHYRGPSPYLQRGLAAIESDLAPVLAALPVEGVRIRAVDATESHILGTTVMGTNPASSVIDRNLVHHAVRNLLVLGGGAFPTTSPANPTLTICALSLRAADCLFGVPRV